MMMTGVTAIVISGKRRTGYQVGSTTLESSLSSNGPTSLARPGSGKLWIAPIPGAAGVVVDIPRRHVPMPGRVPKRSLRVDRQAHQREHRDDSGNRYLGAGPERF